MLHLKFLYLLQWFFEKNLSLNHIHHWFFQQCSFSGWGQFFAKLLQEHKWICHITSGFATCDMTGVAGQEWSRVTCKGFFRPALIQYSINFDLQSFLMMVVLLLLLLYENVDVVIFRFNWDLRDTQNPFCVKWMMETGNKNKLWQKIANLL